MDKSSFRTITTLNDFFNKRLAELENAQRSNSGKAVEVKEARKSEN